jgi:hypothetical protein
MQIDADRIHRWASSVRVLTPAPRHIARAPDRSGDPPIHDIK